MCANLTEQKESGPGLVGPRVEMGLSGERNSPSAIMAHNAITASFAYVRPGGFGGADQAAREPKVDGLHADCVLASAGSREGGSG